MKIGLQRKLYNAELRGRREALGMTQRELARASGVKLASVSSLETLRSTNPDVSSVKKIAQFLGVDSETICPRWLVLMDGIPRRSDQRTEVTAPMLKEIVLSEVKALPPMVSEPQQFKEAVTKELDVALSDALGVLTYTQRQVVILKYGLEGQVPMSHVEIAQQVGISDVSHHLQRAIRRIEGSPTGKRLQNLLWEDRYETSV
jgi:transcriptional regulator with XRE-family HTH domain